MKEMNEIVERYISAARSAAFFNNRVGMSHDPDSIRDDGAREAAVKDMYGDRRSSDRLYAEAERIEAELPRCSECGGVLRINLAVGQVQCEGGGECSKFLRPVMRFRPVVL